MGSRGSHASTRPRGEMTRAADSAPEPRLNGKGRGGRGSGGPPQRRREGVEKDQRRPYGMAG